MALRPAELAAELERGLKSVYLVSGDELLLVQEACDAIVAAARAAGYSEREIIQVETGFRWSELTDASRAMSLFAERRLLDVRVPAKRFDKDAAPVLEAYVGAPPPDTLLLLRSEQLDRRQRNAAWFKAIERNGVALTVWPLDARELPRWVAARCRSAGLTLRPDALQLFVDNVEGNLLAAAQEIEKLKLAGMPQPVTAEALAQAIADAAHYDAFDLVDAALLAQPGRVRHIVAVLAAEGVAPLAILGALTTQLRRLLSGDARGLPRNRETAMRGARARLALGDIETLLGRAFEIDCQVKGVAPGDPWQSLERLALALAGITLDQTAKRA
jgi:DNA polymerase III subunit delta